MTTLEKIEKKRRLEIQIHELKLKIREEQRKCKHKYKSSPSFNSEYFYYDCIKCGHRTIIKHGIDISTNTLYEQNKNELIKNWNILMKTI